MSFDDDRHYTLAKARLLFPAGAQPSYATLERWTRTGVSCVGGGRAYLQTVRVGGVRYVTRAMIRRFLRQLNGVEPEV